MDSNIHIRPANMHDAELLGQMAIDFRNHNQKTEPSDDAFKSGVIRLLDSNDALFLIAFYNHKPCGYTLLRFRFSMWTNGIDASLEDLYVDESFRRMSIGKQLVESALTVLKQQNAISVHLDTNENNPASNKIYQQLGFSCISKRWNGRQLFYRRSL